MGKKAVFQGSFYDLEILAAQFLSQSFSKYIRPLELENLHLKLRFLC